MKHIIIALFCAMMLASPAAVAASGNAVSAVQDKKVKKTATVVFNVNMHCKNCVAKVTDNISFLKGVEDLKVSLEDKQVTITYNTAKTDEATLQKAIEKLGYTVEKVTQH